MSSSRSAEPAAEAEPEEEGVPDWLTGPGHGGDRRCGDDADQRQAEAEPAPHLEPATDWLSSLRHATPEMEAEQAQAEAEADEVPEWLRESGLRHKRSVGRKPTNKKCPIGRVNPA